MRHKIEVKYEGEDTASRELQNLCKKAANAALKHMRISVPCGIFILLCSNEKIKSMNYEHRNMDKPTDVLSFPMLDLKPGTEINPAPFEIHPETGEIFLGDIVISVEKMREQALSYGHEESREISFLTIHAVLHLLGYDHEGGREEAAAMRKAERQILASLA